MKFKYFMRGLGMGILFCTLIIFAAYQTSPNKLLTDEEVKARAKQLGMVEQESELDKVLGDTTEESSADTEGTTIEESSTDTEGTTTEESSADTEGTTTEESSTDTEGTTIEESSTDTEATTTEADTATTTAINTEVTVTITVKKGMDSSAVARLLEKEGIIESAAEFDSYLDKNGYSTKICVGSYTVSSTDSYETIAKIITHKQ